MACLLWSAPATAVERWVGPAGWLVEHWDRTDGLPSDAAFALGWSPDGRLAVGTADGLALFDGARFEVLRSGEPSGPPGDRIVALINPEPDELWVITSGSQVQRRTRHAPEEIEVPGKILAIGSHEDAAYVFMQDNRIFRLDQTLVLDPAADPDTIDWVEGSHAGALQLDIHRRLVLDGETILPDIFNVGEVTEGNDGDYWIAAQHGLLRLSRAPIQVRTAALLPDVNHLIATVHVKPQTNQVSTLLGEHGWWELGRAPQPLNRPTYDDDPDALWRYPIPIWAPDGEAFWADVWMWQRPGPDLPLERVEHPPCVAVLQAWTVWDGRVYTGWGSVYADGQWSTLPGFCSTPFAGVRAMATVPSVGVVLGGTEGLSLMSAAGQTTPIKTPAPWRVRHVRVGAGRLWVATEASGLCSARIATLETGPPWRCLSRASGFPENQLHASLVDDDARVWMSSNRGLYVASGASVDAFMDGARDDVPVVNLGARFGSGELELNGFTGFSGAQSADGRLWFPAGGGVVEVLPWLLSIPDVPDFVLAAAVGDEPVPHGQISLETNHPPLQLLPQARSLLWADQVTYRVRVNDGPWLQGPQALWLNRLPPTRSQITVQARLTGAWGPAQARTVYRQPTLTERTWFPSVILVGILSLAGAVGMGRLQQTRRRERELRQRVAEHTEQLRGQNTRLSSQTSELLEANEKIQAQALRLAELDTLKKKLIADIAHELRTPLTLVLGSLELLQDSPLVTSARLNARALHELTEELLALSTLDAGHLQPRIRRVNLASLIEDLATRFRPGFAERKLTVSVPEALVLWADPYLLERLLGNLLSNALKHGAGPTILRAHTGDVAATVSVRDHGPGVPAHAQERIFERFVQLSTGDRREHAGAGIGLALVRDIAELHGGHAGVSTPDGGGATFWVRLPLGRDHVSIEDIDLEAPAAAPTPDAPTAGRPAILVVEDNPEMQAFLVQILAERYTVQAASNGQQALDAIREQPPGLVVSDVRMPTMDGLSMARALRDAPETADLPLVFVSAKAQPEDRALGLTLAQAYLSKPFSIATLRATVASLLPPADRPPEQDTALMERLRTVAGAGLPDSGFGVSELARAMSMSTRTLQTHMKDAHLPQPRVWLLEQRLARARVLMQSGETTVGEVAAAVGMSRSYFSRAYRAWAGHPPKQELRRS